MYTTSLGMVDERFRCKKGKIVKLYKKLRAKKCVEVFFIRVGLFEPTKLVIRPTFKNNY